MKMLRHFFISDDLDDLEVFEEQLEQAGIPTGQIHVLTMDDTAAENHVHLHDVQSLMKRDVVHSMMVGAITGTILAILVLVTANAMGWTNTAAGWMPFIFLAIIALGFSTWEGGFYGIQRPNFHFSKFEDVLNSGRHVFFVDLEPKQESTLDGIVTQHPTAEMAGTGPGTPHFIVAWQRKLTHFFGETMP